MQRNELIAAGDSVLVALSGGPDSVALLHLLSRLRKPLNLELGAVYVNHQIRKKAALAEERFCRNLCDKLGVTFYLVREDIPRLAKERKAGLEETAREFRYAAFEKLAEEHRYDRVAVGHHADDQVETILFRLFRGTGPGGLVGMPARRGRIIRPLIDLTRAEILAYLKKHRLKWCEDLSNRSLKFKRNYIRHELLPRVRENLNPSVDRAILNLADTLREDELHLESETDQAARKCLTMTPGGKFCLALDKLGSYAVSTRRRLLRRCVKATWQSETGPGKDVVARLEALTKRVSGTITLPGQARAEAVSGRLYIFRTGRRRVRQVIEPGQSVNLPWPLLRVTARMHERDLVRLEKRPRSDRVLLDWECVMPPLVLTPVRPGDRFRPLGMKGTKKIGDFMTDRKVPRPLRDEILVLRDKKGPIWLLGYEIADRVKIDDATKKVLSVAYRIRRQAFRKAI